MYELSEGELYRALEHARGIDQDAGQKLLMQFETDQPLFFQTIFNAFYSIIGEQNEPLANYFSDLCFDILAVYRKSFGSMPKFQDDPTWLERQAMQMDTELKPLVENKRITKAQSKKMQENFYKAKEGEMVQSHLVNFLNECVDDFATYNTCNPSSLELTKAMLFVVVKLFNSLYAIPKRATTVH